MNKKLIYGIATGVILFIGFFIIFTKPNLPELPGGRGIDTSAWLTYENEDFDFKIMHPADWVVYEAPDHFAGPAFNIYPKSYEAAVTSRDLPLIHHSPAPNVSIFPHGVPTEGVFGETAPSTVEFTESPMRAFDFLLENGDRWATFAGYPYGPRNYGENSKTWMESGFIWARAEIENYNPVCLRDGKEMPVESCDFLGSTDQLIHRGQVDKAMRAIEVEILKSFQFTVQTTGGMIRIEYPKPGDVIKSPLVVRGEARGNWYFEADFPITLTNWDGKIIADSYATAQGEWMTTEFVPFEGKIEFKNPSSKQDFTKNGYLIFHNNNASGEAHLNRAIEIPIRFE